MRVLLCLLFALGVHLALFIFLSSADQSLQVQGGGIEVRFSAGSNAADALPQGDAETEETNPDSSPISAHDVPRESILAEPEPASTSSQAASEINTEADEQDQEQTSSSDTPSSETREVEPSSRSESETEADDKESSSSPSGAAVPTGEGAAPDEGSAAEASSEESASTSRATTPGNSADANYAGEVMKHLSRIRRPRSEGPGSATVRFIIGEDGELVEAEISESSGSSRFDRQALRLIKRAAPFPRPPSGVNREFTVEIEGR